MGDIILKQYDFDTKEMKEIGTANTYTIARSMTPENFVDFLDEYMNSFKDFKQGEDTGKRLHTHHRTIQASIARFCLGVIVGIGEQEHTDPRNEKAVAMGKQLKRMLDEGSLEMGYMI